MVKIEIVYATHDHAHYVAARMRAADVREVYRISGLGPLHGLLWSLENSHVAWTVLVNNEPACLFGLAHVDLSFVGQDDSWWSPWMLGTDRLAAYPLHLLRYGRAIVQILTHRCGRLQNWVDAENTAAIQFLEWVGFTLDSPAPCGAFSLPFRRFERRAAGGGLCA